MKILLFFIFFLAVLSKKPKYWFLEKFDDDFSQRWITSEKEKYDGTVSWDSINGKLVIPEMKKNYGIIAPIKPTITNRDKSLIIQFELKYSRPVECTGGYIKLIYDDSIDDFTQFDSNTKFAIMFGADICKVGKDRKDKIVFFYNHYNEKCEKYREVKFTRPPVAKNDILTHLYTLKIRPDNTFEIYIDMELIRKGSFFKEFEPPIVPPRFFKKHHKKMSKPKNVKNKCYYVPDKPYLMHDIGSIAIDIYSGYSANTTMDDILITWDDDFADKYAQHTWGRQNIIETYERPFHYDDDFEIVWDGPEKPAFEPFHEDEL